MDQSKVNSTFYKISSYDAVKNIHTVKPEYILNEHRVYNQALRHNIYLDKIDLIQAKFPNESDLIQKYRHNNKRQFTKEVPRKIMQGVVSVLNNIPIKVNSNNTKFNTWFESNPFNFKGDSLDFFVWSINCIIPYAFIDPNAILVPFPQFRGEFEVIGINPMVVPYNRRYVDPAGEFVLILDEDSKGFYVADKTSWFRAEVGTDIAYTLVYNHELNELPFVYMSGLSSFDEKTRQGYNESILAATYEYLDEALVSFTTDQAVRLKMNSILIRPGLLCTACNGEGVITNESGKAVDCSSCGGTRLAKRPSDLDDFVVPPADSLQGDGKIPVKPEYINPDTAVAEFHAKNWKDYLNEGKRSVGIDALIDRAESGEAMKKRLASFEEFMSYLIYLTYRSTLTKFFEICHKLLNVNKADWVDFPAIVTPKRIEIKTPEILKQNFNEAVGSEKITAAMDYYNSIYADNPTMLRTMKLVVENYPASIENTGDLQTLQLLGVYTSRQIAKAKRALIVIKRLIEGQGTQEKTDEQILKEAETELDILVPDQIAIAPQT